METVVHKIAKNLHTSKKSQFTLEIEMISP